MTTTIRDDGTGTGGGDDDRLLVTVYRIRRLVKAIISLFNVNLSGTSNDGDNGERNAEFGHNNINTDTGGRKSIPTDGGLN